MHTYVTKADCQEIVNKNLQGGGSENTPLEIALAKHALELHESLEKAKRERGESAAQASELRYALFSVYNTCMTAAGDELVTIRKGNLAAHSMACFKRAVELDAELKKMG